MNALFLAEVLFLGPTTYATKGLASLSKLAKDNNVFVSPFMPFHLVVLGTFGGFEAVLKAWQGGRTLGSCFSSFWLMLVLPA